MGVSTHAIIRNGVTIEELKAAIEKKYENVIIEGTHKSNYMQLIFDDGQQRRNMSVFLDDTFLLDYGIKGVGLSLGRHGKSVEIMRYLCETFGGYIDENDCDDEPFYPINIELYNQGKDFTPKDLFINKVIHKVGYKNLHSVLELLDEYIELSSK